MKADKKKIIIIATLGVALLGIGAWQFIGGKADPPATPRQGRKATTPDNALASTVPGPETIVSPDISLAGLTRKDPFVPGKLKDEPPTTPVTKPTPPVTSNPTPPGIRRGPRGPLGNVYTGGPLIPTVVPGANGNPAGSAPPAQSGYQLIGVVEGPHPVAVFRSQSGMQTMVKLYGALGEGGRITGIKDGKVTVHHSNGNTTTIQVGGNSQ